MRTGGEVPKRISEVLRGLHHQLNERVRKADPTSIIERNEVPHGGIDHRRQSEN